MTHFRGITLSATVVAIATCGCGWLNCDAFTPEDEALRRSYLHRIVSCGCRLNGLDFQEEEIEPSIEANRRLMCRFRSDPEACRLFQDADNRNMRCLLELECDPICRYEGGYTNGESSGVLEAPEACAAPARAVADQELTFRCLGM